MAKAKVSRQYETGRTDARYVCTVTLSTGAELEMVSGWQPSHHDAHARSRYQVVAQAREEMRDLTRKYGITASGPLRIVEEIRTVTRYTETRTTSRFHSEVSVERGEG